MSLSKEVIDFIKSTEKLVLSPYKNKGDRWTIGYGNTFYENGIPVRSTDKPITKERAEELFRRISNNMYASVKACVSSTSDTSKLSALTSFAYNVGIDAFKNSTLLKVVNNDSNDFANIEFQLNRWNKSDNKILNGLITRRKNEFLLYKKKTNIMKKITDYLKDKKNLPIVAIGAIALAFGIYKIFKR
jgi:lysozyme